MAVRNNLGGTNKKSSQVVNALSIDVEDWYHVALFRHILTPDLWPFCESRIRLNIERILKLLSDFNVKATFFILGWIAEKSPEVIKIIDKEGHEISSHGYSHIEIYKQNFRQFRQEMRRCVSTLEDITGKKVLGFRAPSYSLTENLTWVWDVLLELGFKYDSSLFPVKHDTYGMIGAPRFPCKINHDEGSLVEFPLATIRIFNSNIPIAGGGYLRLFPYFFINKGIRHVNLVEHEPVVIYFHPWEIDDHQPRVKTNIFRRMRHYGNINSNYQKIERLLNDFQFTTIKDTLGFVS